MDVCVNELIVIKNVKIDIDRFCSDTLFIGGVRATPVAVTENKLTIRVETYHLRTVIDVLIGSVIV